MVDHETGITNAALDRFIGPRATRLYLILVTCSLDRVAHMSIKDLADVTGWSGRTVQRALASLIDRGYVTRVDVGCGGSSMSIGIGSLIQ